MVRKYDFVITSGGIGPTHDGASLSGQHHVHSSLPLPTTDITYESLAKAFGQELEYHEETLYRITQTNKSRGWVSLQNKEQILAQNRMALFPNRAEVLFASPDIWIVRIHHQYANLLTLPNQIARGSTRGKSLCPSWYSHAIQEDAPRTRTSTPSPTSS